ncbi:MAG: DUF3047 domain-containing protein [Desulfobulbaceae bacterium]|nr:DUF3047 domain-containing protein [Desulfobulbaceae bacterium]
MHKIPFVTLLALLLLPAGAQAGSRLIDDFRSGAKSGWEGKSFKGETHYFPVVEDGVPCLRAEATASASGLFYKIEYNAATEPILTWSWKVDNIIVKGDARTKAGDDYPARIYVVFPSLFFWKTKALNYVWATGLPEGTAIPNSFTSNAVMVAVESGPAHVGQWRSYRRDIYQDFRKYFGSEPPPVGAIAIMTDTDNTGETASACYGAIRVESPATPIH